MAAIINATSAAACSNSIGGLSGSLVLANNGRRKQYRFGDRKRVIEYEERKNLSIYYINAQLDYH